MSIYRFSSQFTDYILRNSANPDKILLQVGDAIASLGETGALSEYQSARLSAFHEDPSITDLYMMELLEGDEDEKKAVVNGMYPVLGRLAGTGKVDMVTRRVIEKFLDKVWKKLPVQENPLGAAPVIRRKKPTEGGPSGEGPSGKPIVLREPLGPKWERQEDRMINRIDNAYASLVQAGILEQAPDADELNTRLEERKYKWALIIQ